MHGVDPAQFRQLLGRFATGVTILTTRDARGHPIGMTASSVASVSLEPPLLLVCVDRGHDMHAAMQSTRRFVLNVLAADQEALSRRFAADHPNRFDGIGYTESEQGLPLLEGVEHPFEHLRLQILVQDAQALSTHPKPARAHLCESPAIRDFS